MNVAFSQTEEINEKSLPTYIRLIDGVVTEDSLNLSDSLFYDISGSVIFKVNRTELRHEDPFIRDLKGRVLPFLRDQNWELCGITMRGAASPEGPYWNNVRLSKGRAAALTSFIGKEMGQPYLDAITTNTVAEDYAYLIRMMESVGDVDTERVRQIFEDAGRDEFKTKMALRAADGGRLWNRIYKVYYPRLRAARAVFFFCRPEQRVEPTDAVSPGYVAPKMVMEIPEPKFVIPEPEFRPRRHLLSVSTNLLYDGFYMPNYGWAPSPNIGLEFYPKSGNWTYAAEFTCPYYHRWSRQQFFQIRDYHLEVRRYFNPGDLHTGWFLGATANANVYGIGLSKKKGWQGEGLGASLKGGYVTSLGRHGRWRLEFAAGLGLYYTRFDPYVYGNPVTGTENGDYYYDFIGNPLKFHKRNHQRIWLGPTELALTLKYDLLYRKIRDKGVSTRHFERIY